ncbi:SixA phosphatase family protein [Roseivirga sp.]|uniref:SixA phosphatase family protein n=1 Tax=Roseivirga sp. TaxID=1964215 RepID=UPI003B8AC60B
MVKNILLIRHAEAGFGSSQEKDFQRKLTTKGRSQATILGEYVNALPLRLDAFYVSPATRTLTTCALVNEQLEYEPRIMDAEELYEATENLMKAFLKRIDPLFKTIAIVAHNPAIAQVYSYLTMDFKDFYPGTCAWLELTVDDWKHTSSNVGIEKDYYYPGMSR